MFFMIFFLYLDFFARIMNVCAKPIKPYYEWGNLKLGSKLVPIDYMNCNIMLLQLQIQQELNSFPNTYISIFVRNTDNS